MQIELNRSDYLYYTIKKLFGLYLYGLFVMMGFRLFFYLYFSEKGLWSEYSSDILKAFYMGLRYDSMVLSYLLVVPFVFMFIGTILKVKPILNFIQFFSGVWSYIFLFLVTIVLMCDVAFYSFFQDHINILIYGVLEDDTQALAESIWKNYPVGWGILGIGLFSIFQFIIIKKIFKFFKKNRSLFHPGFFKFIFGTLLVCAILVIANRGGVSELVLAPKYADFSKSQFVNGLSLNGVFSLERTMRIRSERSSEDFSMADHFGYKDNIHQAFTDYLGFDTTPTREDQLISLVKRKTVENKALENQTMHVVVFVMESFGAYWLRYHSNEFNILGPLEKFFKEGVYFDNFISSDNGTIGSLLSVATNIPNRPGTRFLSESKFLQLPLGSSSHTPFLDRGYETSFVYGGKLGWRDIGKYFSKQGFHNVEGESHIIKSLNIKKRAGTEWGVYDGYFFDHILKKLNDAKRPQFIMSLSTSNHPPFEWPKDFKPQSLNVPPELKNRITREVDLFDKRFKAFQYSNFMLGKFLEEISNSPLKDKTIVAVTGDHNFWGFMNYHDSELFEKYKVPFFIMMPENIRPKNIDTQKFASHEDIMPTLYNLSLSKTDYLAFGRDLFGQNESFALNPNVYAGEKGLINSDGKFFKWKDAKGLQIDLEQTDARYPELEKYFKSVLSIADYYLHQLLNETKKDQDN